MKVVSKYKVQSWTLNIDWWSRGECGDPAPHYISHMDQNFNINRNTYFTMVQPQSKSSISIIHQNWIIYYTTIKSKSCYGQNAMPTKKICLQSRPLSSWNIHLNIAGCCTVVYSCVQLYSAGVINKELTNSLLQDEPAVEIIYMSQVHHTHTSQSWQHTDMSSDDSHQLILSPLSFEKPSPLDDWGRSQDSVACKQVHVPAQWQEN